MRRRRPPLLTCLRCRREFRGWKLNDCPTCKSPGAENASETAAMVKEARLRRRAGS